MAERLTKCLACDGRGYFRCDCWPGDCICDEGDQNCFECGGDGFTDEGEEQGGYWPDEELRGPPPAEKMVVTPGYRLSHWKDGSDELEAALDAFWNAAYTQGQQKRGHDDKQESAQAAEDNLRQIIAKLAAPAKHVVGGALTCQCANTITDPCIVCGKGKTLVTAEWLQKMAAKEGDLDPTTGRPELHVTERVEVEIASVVQSVNEWDDRTSPDDYPDHLLITSEELADILRNFAATLAAEVEG